MTQAAFSKPVVLCILDGWGDRAAAPDNAITEANAPTFRKLMATRPHALLDASEEHVGLPQGQMGNSEVGHMNLGAGRVVFQDLPLIDRTIARHELATLPELTDFISKMKASGGTVHMMGLVSDGGVHAHSDHMIALAKILDASGLRVALHAFMDGRDTPPHSGVDHLGKLVNAIAPLKNVFLATLCGRYYAMDRDKRWERVSQAYDLLTEGKGTPATDPLDAVRASYAADVTDEFIKPIVLDDYQGMNAGDGVLFTHYRADRAREILTALLDPSFTDFPRHKTIACAAAVGMVVYSDKLAPLMGALFPPKIITNTLGECVAKAGLKQLRIAETEKYPHVTFFFNGGREEPYAGEERILVPSPKVATYDLQPEMSASLVTDRVVEALAQGTLDLVILNYANPDMVGHTGFMKAAIQAVETIDACLARLVAAVDQAGGSLLITADHGNIERMTDPVTHAPHTAHTLARVPVILARGPAAVTALRDGKLADVAPTLLALLHLPQPEEMDGQSLLVMPS